ncbi:MAG: T9SS type A sorting domain-containing protein [Bacteroidetes bacterium]|nr:T9SS type A sorting domain-containing protein [Bacteroidota bacterium]
MGGDGVSIGQNQIAPISNRTYEILGQASNPNSWAAYRYREIEDVMINAVIQPISIGLNENDLTNQLSNVYPNPAMNNIHINYNFTESTDLSWSILDVTGKSVAAGKTGTIVASGTLQIDISTIPSGVYMLSLSNGSEFYNKKVTVIR